MAEFSGGIADKAQDLRDNGIDPGEPLEDEAYFPDGSHSLQFSTTGVFMYSNAGKVHFFEGV